MDTATPEIEIFVLTSTAESHSIKIARNATVHELKQKIQHEQGIPSDQIMLLFAGKFLSDRNSMSYYNIQQGSSVHLWLGCTRRPKSALTDISHIEPCAEASAGDYDDDIYIVDPQSHFLRLRQLEESVVQRSEYFNTQRKYDTASIVDPKDDDGVFLDDIGLRPQLQRKIRGSSIVSKSLQGNITHLRTFWHLLESYRIISNVSRSLEQMKRLRFCTDSISVLLTHHDINVIQLKRIPLIVVTDIEMSLETTLGLMTDDLDTDMASLIHSDPLLLPTCAKLLDLCGFKFLPSALRSMDKPASITVVRKIALILDLATVSYVRSHGSGFDKPYFGDDLSDLEVSHGDDPLKFTCSWVRLACLDSFLDRKRVWVFRISHKFPDNFLPEAARQAEGPKSLLTRMEDLADIWGPVYTVPSSLGDVEFYGVSKGVICRVKAKNGTAIKGAVQCHYYSRLQFFRKRASRLLSGTEDLVLSKGDLLLIGAGFRLNDNCHYTLSAFTEKNAPKMTVLGTKESVWRPDSRSLAIGITKYFGITVSGTQKLIPQTTLKQHILDKWTTIPSRANPGILNHFLGVEFSHCTGNARRISLRQLMITSPIWALLERQVPDWIQTPWGSAFSAALLSTNTEDIFQVWREFAASRSNIAELVCCVLGLLDGTGWDEQDSFHSAVLFDNEERKVQVDKNLNNWLIILQDTHLAAAYVITHDVCIECEVPDHSTSTCELLATYTVLQTELSTTKSLGQEKDLLLKSSNLHLSQVDCGSSDIVLYQSNYKLRYIPKVLYAVLIRAKCNECLETLRPTKGDLERSTIYLRASARSDHGRQTIERALTKLPFNLKLKRHRENIDQKPATYNPKGEEPQRYQIKSTSPRDGDFRLPLWGGTHNTGTQLQQPLATSTPIAPTRSLGQVQEELPRRQKEHHRDGISEDHHRSTAARPNSERLTARRTKTDDDELITSDIYGQDSYDFATCSGGVPFP
ncbi:MAG: hypothetical protein Q9223_001649 [Gallowayella weberi]